MSVDVSPDGRTIVFDLLGDLYSLPIRGGRATRLTDGPAFDAQPRFSPDGRSLAFVSDRDGTDALWAADADGQRARVLVAGAHRSPAWSPDGRCVAATKLNASGSTEVMLYCRKADTDSLTPLALGNGAEPAFSADGRYVYFFAPSRQSNMRVYDRVDGRARIFAHLGGARPAVSPDGKLLVTAVAYDERAALKVLDLASGDERWLTLDCPPLNTADPSRDALPRYAFTPDGKALVGWNAGKLWRLNIATGRRTPVPFTAEVRQALEELRPVRSVRTDAAPAQARRVRSARASPDGRWLAFVALGKVWVQALPQGTPRRLTADSVDEFAPGWSPDGQYLAYATWDPQGGHIYRQRIGSGGPTGGAERLTRTPAYFDCLTYATDGRRLLALRTAAAERRQLAVTGASPGVELVWLPAAGGEPTAIASVERPSPTFVGRPLTTSDTGRVYVSGAAGLLSLRWDGRDRQVVVKGAADDMVLSPDGKWLAVLNTDSIAVRPASGSGSAHTLPRLGADALAWSADSRTLVYASGTTVYRHDVGASGSPAHQELVVPFRRDVAPGTVVLRGARLITMKGREVIERGDLVITDGRIAAVGANLPVPAGAHVVDVSGATILPGYIDVWTTFRLLPNGSSSQPWEFLTHLAYGVTTVREPGPTRPDVLEYADRVELGELLGPRYLVPDALPARADQIDWRRALAMARGGAPLYAGTIPVTPMARDLIQVLAHSGITYVPGLVRNDDGPLPMDQFIAQGRYHDDPKLQRFVPHVLLDEATLQRPWTRPERYRYPSYAADVARFVAAGGRATVGSRGAFPGLGVHWELWALAAGGLATHDVLRAGTIAGAEALGVARDLGSLEPGKLADLQVLDRNPLEDIRGTTALRYIMKSGRLYEAATLTEVWPRRRTLPAPWWSDEDPASPMGEFRTLSSRRPS